MLKIFTFGIKKFSFGRSLQKYNINFSIKTFPIYNKLKNMYYKKPNLQNILFLN